MSIVIALVILITIMVIGVPIPMAFLGSAAYLIFAGGYDPSFVFPYGYSKMNSMILLTIPLFILAGSVMNAGGIGEKLVSTVERLTGRVKGGLGITTVLACALFSSVSGSASATTSAIGSIMAPRLEAAGYNKGMSAALIASSGVLGVLLPPSALMIVYAWLANQSVLASFLAVTVPGCMLIVLFSTVSYFMTRKNPNIKVYTKAEFRELMAKEKGQGFSLRNSAFPALLMPVIILGSIYGGFLTPTEAAALSVLYAVPVGMFVYKKLTLKSVKKMLMYAGATTGVIMIMLFTVMILSRLYLTEQLPQHILNLLVGISPDPNVILFLIIIFMMVLGMLMDDTSGMLLFTPILLPVVTQIGVDPIHFAAIIGVCLGMANVTPPTAPLLYLSGRICGAQLKDMLKPIFYLIVFAWIPTLFLVVYIPDLALWLPRLILG